MSAAPIQADSDRDRFLASVAKSDPYALAISREFGADVQLLHVTDVTQQPPRSLLTLPVMPQIEWNQRFMKRLEAEKG